MMECFLLMVQMQTENSNDDNILNRLKFSPETGWCTATMHGFLKGIRKRCSEGDFCSGKQCITTKTLQTKNIKS